MSGSDDRTLKLWDAETGAEVGTWNCGWPVQCVAFHPQQPDLAVAALTNGTLALIDLRIR